MRKVAAALVAAVVGVCAQAEASPITITLADTVYDATALDAGFRNGGSLGSFQLTIDSAAIARGSFTIRGARDPAGSSITGNLADFISASTVFGDGVSPTVNFSTFNTQLTFDPTGSVVSGSIDFSSNLTGQTLSGSASQFSGRFGGDNTRCGADACAVAGRLVVAGLPSASVPEPMSVALLLVGMVGLAASRHRPNARSASPAAGKRPS